MPTSWPKDDATLSSHCLLRFTTLPSQQSHPRTDRSTWSTHQFPQKRFLFTAFLHGEVFPALPTTPFSSIASCLGAFLRAGFSQKRSLSSFHLSCLPCSFTFSITTLEHRVALSSTLPETEHDSSISLLSKPNQRLTNEGLKARVGCVPFEGMGALCLVGNVFSSSSFIYPLQLFREAEFGSFVDVAASSF